MEFLFLLADEVVEVAPTIWEQITNWCAEYAPTLYTIIGSLSGGSFLLLIWKGIPKLTKLFGLNEATTVKVQKIVDDNAKKIAELSAFYGKLVDRLAEQLKEQYSLSSAKDDIIVHLLYTIITDSKIQASGKEYATKLLQQFEKLTVKNVDFIEEQLSEKLKEKIENIPEVIRTANEEIKIADEEISIIDAIDNQGATQGTQPEA